MLMAHRKECLTMQRSRGQLGELKFPKKMPKYHFKHNFELSFSVEIKSLGIL